MPGILSFLIQLFPPKPKFVEKDLPDLKDKVFIVTGSNTGAGKEIAKLLYSRGGKVYMAARSEKKALSAIADIQNAVPKAAGQLIFLPLDLSDLEAVKGSAANFLSKESKLHVLFNNAGVGYPEKGSRTAQGYETTIGVNCVAPFLFTKLLSPTLVATAKTAPPNSVRVVWTSSSAAESVHPTDEVMANLDYHNENVSSLDRYGISKLGNYLHANEYAARYKADGVVSISINPGALDSDFWREQARFMVWFMQRTILYPAIYGAYTSIWAAFSPEVTTGMSGVFVAPWGRFWKVSKQMIAATKTKAEGGTGIARYFWEWSEEQIRPFL